MIMKFIDFGASRASVLSLEACLTWSNSLYHIAESAEVEFDELHICRGG